MLIDSILFNILLRFRVVHSIPGRLRIHIPKASKIPAEWKPAEADLDFFRQINGIHDVSFSYVTGNALIHYDPSIITEEEILSTFKGISKLLIQHRQEIKGISAQRSPEDTRLYLIRLVQNQLWPESPTRKDGPS
ncbi:HMA2 domain-containing protein [Tindallia californiensis]|uniref:Uncharacterized protein n=1 Tax=Tindallia californiensis TaxID=159292 RepID=A0A1H3MD70_9FIRM|nr:hypothetical protein [Tindallia californiensis]SDY74651.1 hypothetical protein SAMN05192546_10490 [Tindallia californiensis]